MQPTHISVAVAMGSVLALAVGPTSLEAAGPRVTRGEAQAVFEAFSGGGWAISLHYETMEGAPSDFLPDAIVRISVGSGFNGLHYCALDWHVIHVALNEGNLAGETRTNSELMEALANRNVELKLDGTILATTRTAARRSLIPNRGFTEAFFVNIGRVMAPEDIAVGQHTLVGTGFRPGLPPQTIGTTNFFIDAAGTGACVSNDALTFREVP